MSIHLFLALLHVQPFSSSSRTIISSVTVMFAAPILRNAASSSSATASAFSQAHKSYVKSLYRRYLKNSLDWCIRRDIWRDRAIEIRVEFERHRNVRNPRELANLFEKAERELKRNQHPDPHRRKFLPLSFTGDRWVSLAWRSSSCTATRYCSGLFCRGRFRTATQTEHLPLKHTVTTRSRRIGLRQIGFAFALSRPATCHRPTPIFLPTPNSICSLLELQIRR